MRTLKMVIEYHGGAYQGWQVQPHAPTIQGEIEARLARILGSPHRIHGAGRTDAGVHARGQVAHVHTEHTMAPTIVQRALNATLPRDIAILSVEEVAPSFHARICATGKRYTYQILNRRHRSVFLEPFSWHLIRSLDFETMSIATRLLLGKHDFSAFCAADCTIKNRVRRIDRVEVRAHQEGLHLIAIEGSGFLKHMVRIIVGSLVEVGLGRWTADDFARVLAGGDRRLAGRTAPARGLCLEWVRYDPNGE